MIKWIIVAGFIVTTANWASIILQKNKIEKIVKSNAESMQRRCFSDDFGTYTFRMWSEVATHWESNAAILLLIFQWIAPCHRHVIDNPMMLIIQTHALLQCVHSSFTLGIIFPIRTCAYLLKRLTRSIFSAFENINQITFSH